MKIYYKLAIELLNTYKEANKNKLNGEEYDYGYVDGIDNLLMVLGFLDINDFINHVYLNTTHVEIQQFENETKSINKDGE